MPAAEPKGPHRLDGTGPTSRHKAQWTNSCLLISWPYADDRLVLTLWIPFELVFSSPHPRVGAGCFWSIAAHLECLATWAPQLDVVALVQKANRRCLDVLCLIDIHTNSAFVFIYRYRWERCWETDPGLLLLTSPNGCLARNPLASPGKLRTHSPINYWKVEIYRSILIHLPCPLPWKRPPLPVSISVEIEWA